MCFVSLVCLVALFGFVRPARLTFRGGEECKPLAIAAVTVGVQGEADWHVDLLAIVPDALSQDDRDTFAGFGFTIVPRPPFLPLKGRELLRQFGIAEGLL